MLKKIIFILVGLSLALTFLGSGWDGGGGGGYCTGSVQCINTDWGLTYYVFTNNNDSSPIIVISNGAVSSIAWLYSGNIYALEGPPSGCWNASMNAGGADTDFDGIPDWLFTSASAQLNICGSALKLESIVIESVAYSSVYGTYQETAYLSLSSVAPDDDSIEVEQEAAESEDEAVDVHYEMIIKHAYEIFQNLE